MNSTISAELTEYPRGSYRDIVDYVQGVINQDPIDLYAKARQPAPSRMPERIRIYANNAVDSTLLRNVHIGSDPDDGNVNMTGVIEGALIDTQDFLRDSFDTRRNNITPEAAARIIHAPETLYVLAGLALQAGSREGEKADMTPNYRHHFAINRDMTAIEMGNIFVTEKNRGCPFAGKNGEIKPTPIFRELGLWAGTMATQAYFLHIQHIDATDALRSAQ